MPQSSSVDDVEEPLIDNDGQNSGSVDGVQAQNGASNDQFGPVSVGAVASNFAVLGWTAFGGTNGAIAMMEQTLVHRRRWFSETVFLEVFSLSSCLPGATASQVAFTLAAVKRGVASGVLGGLLFQHPGLLIMSVLGVGAAGYLNTQNPWVHSAVDGLAAVAVALVAVAGKQLVRKTATDRLTSFVLVASAAAAVVCQASWVFPALIVGGGMLTLAHNTLRRVDMRPGERGEGEGIVTLGLSHAAGAALLAAWAATLIAALAVQAATSYRHRLLQPAHWFATFYWIGSAIYGGGQVVLPMLLQQVVQYECSVDDHGKQHCKERADSWMTEDQFKAGLALIQAMPGPMFNFAAYLGAIIAARAHWHSLLGIAVCWTAMMAPGIMLILGLLPFWGQFRGNQAYRRALPGLMAAAVGLVVFAVFHMYNSFTASSLFPKTSVAIGILAFFFVDGLQREPPLAVALGGACGVLAHWLHLP